MAEQKQMHTPGLRDRDAAFLSEAANFFEKCAAASPEDLGFWANQNNAARCREIAARLEAHEFQQNGPGIIGSDICTICGKEREGHPRATGAEG